MDGAAERERLEQEKKEAKLEKLRKVAEVMILINLEFSNFRISQASPLSYLS